MKKHSQTRKLTLTVLLLSLAWSVPATIQAQTFYEGKADGWFWYNEEPEVIEEEPIEPPPPAPVPIIIATEPAASEPKAPTGPSPLSSAWLQVNMPKYLQAAMDNPTMENVKAYLYLQRVAVDKAEQYSIASQMANIGDPFLDETIRRPASSFAVSSVDSMAGIAKNKLVSDIAQKAGIFFFFSSDCNLCQIQAPLLKSLEDHEGFTIIPISVDGKNLPDSPWDKYRKDNGQAEQLNVTNLPAMFLVDANGTIAPLGQSAYALPELQQRIVAAAKQHNWITDDQYNKTRPILNYANLAEVLTPASGAASDDISSLQKKADPEGFIEPSDLLKYINQKVKE
ncbi:conjugal transfer protein TraF [Eoetvoesiella caeni]